MGLRHRHGFGCPVADAELDAVLTEEGVYFWPFPLAGRLTEILIGDDLLIDPKLPRSRQRWLKAHALGHHCLHCGNQLVLMEHDPVIVHKQECQATIFAGYLLLGDALVDHRRLGIDEIADMADVPATDLLLWVSQVTPETVIQFPAASEAKVSMSF